MMTAAERGGGSAAGMQDVMMAVLMQDGADAVVAR